jgi:hypothetical protein
LASREQNFDRVLKGFTESDSSSQSRAKGDGEFLEFDVEACGGFQSKRRVSMEQVPDLNEKFACDGCKGDIAIASAALALAGVESDVGEEFLGTVEARDVASKGEQGKCADDAHAEDFHATHHLGIAFHLGGNQAIEPFAAFLGLRDIGKILIEPLDIWPPLRVASTHRFHRGHWINHFDLPSAGCCMTSYRYE